MLLTQKAVETIEIKLRLPKKVYDIIRLLSEFDDMTVEEFMSTAVYDRTKASLETIDSSEFLRRESQD